MIRPPLHRRQRIHCQNSLRDWRTGRGGYSFESFDIGADDDEGGDGSEELLGHQLVSSSVSSHLDDRRR